MADASRATPSAEATGFRSCAPQAAGLGADHAHRFTVFEVDAAPRSAPLTVLNSTPRFVRGIPYPLTSDSVRCHA
ncbi:hypothetical protein [Paraburkholderia antibiotica]|uniref:Uncharacterized protein n=1 Tax=Paraburkholderia antibiotica TaxID=2728839 RepID=A0A7X9ZVK2_9BURK|nr:hypothetical protein [Paraburkholderia antibiotica]NML29992.1 hypothetical protein [Paraburkholderia antibiotica]